MSNFAFLAAEFPEIFGSAKRAEALAEGDPRAAAFYARRTVELAVQWAYKHDPGLKFPYQSNISTLIHEPSFQKLAGQAVFSKARVIIKIGNQAVHESRETKPAEAANAVRELFHLCFWLARTYARKDLPADGLAFDPAHLSRKTDVVKRAFAELTRMKGEMEAKDKAFETMLRDKADLDAELKRLRAEVAAARHENEARPDNHDYSEAETRDLYIDLLLKEAGWKLDQPRDREFPVEGMPNNERKGFVDYVLWGDDGKPLALIEAKRTKRDPRAGQQQAKLYADCLEKQFGQRPVIFTSNGYEHWIWDDTAYPQRAVSGFYKKDELALMIQRRVSRKPIAGLAINKKIAGRYYQTRAISRVAETFETNKQRKSLLVMATGSGKTRTVIALVDLLMRAGWVKRVLFLADRVALVNQAVREFKRQLPETSPVNLVTEKNAEGRVFLSTYPTMMNLIDERLAGQARFGPGHFDLVIIDEAHRSVYQRYGAIFDYFDSLLIGLTATPKDEIDRNTYGLFDLEDGVPTDAYSLDKAVEDEYLVPPHSVSVPLRFQREGIRYDDLSDAEKEQWDMLEWDEEDGDPPDSVNAEAVNKWLFNADTVDKVLAHVMTEGLKVAGGDRLGKTIIFAKNQSHAEFIEERFNRAYPHLQAGHFARVITFKTEYAQSLIDDFSKKDGNPHIAISVDMLDTGIDVPEVVNLVLFKLIRSKTKFWQIIGRGTRLCPDLFGPGEDKEFFRVFDYCQNLEFFRQNPQPDDGRNAKSLNERLFAARFDLVRALDEKHRVDASGMAEARQEAYDAGDGKPLNEQTIRDEALDALQTYVAGMNFDNFIVRAKRRAVEKYKASEAWNELTDAVRDELLDEVAPLPSEVKGEAEEAKRFDLLIFGLELALLKGSKSFDRLKKQLIEIASALDEQTAIPIIAAQHPLILDILSDPWWEGITVPLLEVVRLRLRGLVQHIEKGKRKIVYTDFEDELGLGAEIDLPEVGEVDFARFKRKARHFLRDHEDHIAIAKLRHGRPLTPTDIEELQAMLLTAGIGDAKHLEKATEIAYGFGAFVRSLVGLDRAAVAEAFSGFVADSCVTADQIEFIDMVIEHLTEKGAMDPGLLYESPFIDVAPEGPQQVFDFEKTKKLVEVIRELNESAAG
ncbi:DEAD/DEAH box helicase family protein [Rhizobium leguminosarum]|uniref:DEAD/DEAH box helicase family protein n=1 Tax=Rhizobium leguminosarum TaxID=384 RepID=UPI001C945AFC|nr:DEAD/DEAH box helicase family protein [Rhizobium leguminosarum]MBY5673592.1 DEAD/DEAH box helicase family protein [Rhizobium leguminosarum]MBY5687244.1 DEAD/DEAH box helicase family protein [Rhizobium leguminosarum]